MEIMSFQDVAPACATMAVSEADDKHIAVHLPTRTGVQCKLGLPSSLRKSSLLMQ